MKALRRCVGKFSNPAIVFLFTAVTAKGIIIDIPGNTSIGKFGEPYVATFGQTITAPIGENILNSFSFWVNDLRVSSSTDSIDFAGYVMAWDGTKATGPVLYESEVRHTTNNGGVGGYEEFTFSTGGLTLTEGSKYVVFLSASKFFDGIEGMGIMHADIPGSYAGGNFVFLSSGADFNLLTTYSWGSLSEYDAATRLEFSAAEASPTPEPATALFGFAIIGALGLSRRRAARTSTAK